MSALVRYPTPRAGVPDAANVTRLSNLQLEATVPPTPVLEFFVPRRAPREAIETGDVGVPRLYFRLLTSFTIAGVTRDNAGNVLGSCEVALFKADGASPPAYTYQDNTTSDGSGNYSFTGLTDNDAQYMVYSIKDDSPHVFDATDNVIQPV